MNKATSITLYKNVPLDNSYKHVVKWDSDTPRDTALNGYSPTSFTANSFARINERKVRVQFAMTNTTIELPEWNYIKIDNPHSYDIYGFIMSVNYINDNTLEVEYDVDIFTTYFPYVTMDSCMVEREHVDVDTVGAHTLPEPFICGDYITEARNQIAYINPAIVILTDLGTKQEAGRDVPDETQYLSGTSYNTTPISGEVSSQIPFIDGAPRKIFSGENAADNAQHWLNNAIQHNLASRVYGVYVAPSAGTFTDSVLLSTNTARPSKFGNYTPKNNKLLTYPYKYCAMSNNQGVEGIYKYERFSGNPAFNSCTNNQPDCMALAYPTNYKGEEKNFSEGVYMSGYPSCVWTTSAQQQFWAEKGSWQYWTKTALETLYFAPSLAMGNTMANGGTWQMGLARAGGAAANETMATQKDLVNGAIDSTLSPAVQTGAVSGSLCYMAGLKWFTFYKRTIREEQAKAFDEYLSMYGYQVDRVKEPNTTGRTFWNYVKTKNAHARGTSIPPDVLTRIAACFDRGITFWHGIGNICNYTLDNTIVTQS